MKHTIKILFIIIAVACKAQNPIIPLYNSPVSETSGCYIKDMDNDLNPYEGEWKWEDGNSSLTIQFQKVEMFHDTRPTYGNNGIYETYYDSLIGAYKYVENNTELVNSLPLSYNGEDPYDYSINLSIIMIDDRGAPPCSECPSDTRYVRLSLTEPESPQLYGTIVMAYFEENGVAKIRARIFNSGIVNYTADYTGPMSLKVPEGIYTFIKQ